jgi:tRNA pseudouridine(55) synthase
MELKSAPIGLFFNKKPGETMDQLVERVKQILNEKIAYTTRLDPMAKGVCNFLIGDSCNKIKEHLQTNKTYQVKIIFGIKTDSDDPLGIITNIQNVSSRELTIISQQIIQFIKCIQSTSFQQKYHHFSTKMLNHRRRSTQKPDQIKDFHLVSLNNFTVLDSGIYDYDRWKDKIIKTIENIDKKKNFRQKEIIDQWKDLSKKLEHLFYIKIQVEVSSGFFIRQLISDISTHINFPLMAFNINRISIS